MMRFADVLSNSEELANPLFVVGCARSGTGVLAKSIGLSEEVCYVEETLLIPRYYNRRLPVALAIQYWKRGEMLLPILKGKIRRLQETLAGTDYLMELIPSLIRYVKLNGYDLKPPAGKRLIDRYDVTLTSEEVKFARDLYDKYTRLAREEIDRMLRVFFKDFQLLSGKRTILEKTPIHALYVGTLKRIFPQTRICFIMRNGRDVAASYMLNFGQNKSDNRTIRHICRTHRRIQQIREQLVATNDPALYFIQYEDMIKHPVAAMEDVFSFFGLSFSDRVRRALMEVRPTKSNWQELPRPKQIYVETCLGLRRSE